MIWIDGKNKYLGSYETAKQAAKAYDKEAIKARKPLSTLNYPKRAPVGYTPIQQPLMVTNTVGYRGVSRDHQYIAKMFKVQISINGKRSITNGFETAREAAIAYDRAVLKANQSTTLLNFPGMVHNLHVEPKRKKQKVQSSTGYRGVSKLPSGRFRVQIRIDGKQKCISTHDTALSAALAYDQAAIKNGNKSHTLNFPMDQKETKKQKEKKKPKKQKEKKEKKEKTEKMEKMQKKKQKKTKKKELTLQEYKEMLHA